MKRILYKYGPVMRAILNVMDSRGQYCYRRSIKPILPDNIGQNLLYYMSNVYGTRTTILTEA